MSIFDIIQYASVAASLIFVGIVMCSLLPAQIQSRYKNVILKLALVSIFASLLGGGTALLAHLSTEFNDFVNSQIVLID